MGRDMNICCWFFAIICTGISSAAADYVICAGSEHSAACKRLEATRKDVKCLKVADSVDCLQNLLKKKANIGTFTAEEGILASYYIDDEVKVVAEIRHPDGVEEKFAFETVVIVKENFTGGLSALGNTTYCHPGFTQGRYWSDHILKYFESKVVKHFDGKVKEDLLPQMAKEQELYKITNIFRKACRPGMWSVNSWWDKKLKREFSSLCAACDFPAKCSYQTDAYNEHFAALKCLTEKNGDVAYTALDYVKKYFNLKQESEEISAEAKKYKFLCEDGSFRPLSDANTCSWIRQPWTAVVALSPIADDVGDFLKETFSEDNVKIPGWKIALRKVLTNGDRIMKLRERQVKLSKYIREGRVIPSFDRNRRSLNWCSVNDKEKAKCQYMAHAALIFGIPVEIKCSLARSKIECLKKIQRKESDLTFIDTQLGFVARKSFNLTAAAVVETEKSGNYYGVMLMKGTPVKRFSDLKGKSACFPLYNGLGWLSHVQHVRRLNFVPNKLCSDSRVLWNFFSKSCAPGAKNSEINKFAEMTPKSLCEGCASTEEEKTCDLIPENLYYSEIGALRCLNNGDGEVAFVDFHTIKRFLEYENLDDIKLKDYNILCRDETIVDLTLENPEECSITQFNGGEIVVRENLSPNEKRDIAFTLTELDDLFGNSLKQYPPVFRIYESFEGEPDILFKEASVALISAFETQNEYVNNYLKLQNDMSICYRDNKAGKVYLTLLLIISALIVIFVEQ